MDHSRTGRTKLSAFLFLDLPDTGTSLTRGGVGRRPLDGLFTQVVPPPGPDKDQQMRVVSKVPMLHIGSQQERQNTKI